MESNFEQDLEDSEKDFADQFDRTSKTFHGGDTTPVPIGGGRQPESMPTIYKETKIEEIAELVSQIEIKEDKTKTPEYQANVKRFDELMAKRTFMGEIKKVLSEICPPLEGVLRIKAKGLPKEKEDEHIKGELAKVKAIIDKLSTYNEQLMQTEFKEKYCEGINSIIKDAFKDFKDKEDYTNYAFFVKRYSSMAFQEQAKLLDEIKKIKKLL